MCSGSIRRRTTSGVVTLPDGRRFAIAVFLSGSDKPQAAREKIIAEIARAAVQALR